MSQPIPLNYAVAPPEWKKPVRWVVLCTILSIIGVTVWRLGPSAYRQCQLLYWQRRCMNFSLPADAVVYEEEPTAAASLLRRPEYVVYPIERQAGFAVPSKPVFAASLLTPTCWTTLNWIGPRLAAAQPSFSNPNGAISFLHGMVSPSGHRRLIWLRFDPEVDTFTPTFIPGYNYDFQVITPATWTSAPVVAPRAYMYRVQTDSPRRPPLVRIYAGQIDQADRAHFTVRYQMWGQEDLLDGRLLDDDSITLTPRNPPKPPLE